MELLYSVQYPTWRITNNGIESSALGRLMHFNEGLPIMGICFGHQLMCHALGGKVIKNKSVDPEQKGSRKVTFKNRFGGIKSGDVLEFIVSHSWRVTDLPHDFKEVAGSVFPNDIVRHKTLPFVGIQPHPEASDHFIETEFENDSLEKENADRTKVDGIRIY